MHTLRPQVDSRLQPPTHYTHTRQFHRRTALALCQSVTRSLHTPCFPHHRLEHAEAPRLWRSPASASNSRLSTFIMSPAAHLGSTMASLARASRRAGFTASLGQPSAEQGASAAGLPSGVRLSITAADRRIEQVLVLGDRLQVGDDSRLEILCGRENQESR